MTNVKLVTIFFFILGAAFSGIGQTGYVHQQGQSIQNGANQTIKLQGVNIGGWLSWEGWIWGGGFDSQTKMEQIIQKGSDSLFALQFKDSVYNYFIQRKDLVKIKALGLNCVRVPVNYRTLEYRSNGVDLNFKQLDSLALWCRQVGLYVIIDMHAAPGGQSKYFNSNPELVDLWSSETNKTKTVELWTKIATHFKGDTVVAAYDLLNEPDLKNADTLVKFYKRMIQAIRQVDPNHMIMLEGNKFARDFSFFPKNMDANMVYSFHFYPWYDGRIKRQKRLLNYSRQAAYFKTPFWCGEWGEDDFTESYRNRNYLMSALFNFSGTCYWTWKSVRYRKHPNLNKIDVSSDVKLVMNGYKPKETADSKAVLNEFLREMDMDQVITSPELVKMLKSLTDGTLELKR